jgi:hypothetical protein
MANNNKKNNKKKNNKNNTIKRNSKNKGGRPKKEIDWNVFENLCAIQCTLENIAGVLSVSGDYIEYKCKDKYRMSFSEVFKIKRQRGLISLRRKMYQVAMGDEDKDVAPNVTMLIWLSKNWLDFKDKKEWSGDEHAPIIVEVVKAKMKNYPEDK